jgi:hypothetical protein
LIKRTIHKEDNTCKHIHTIGEPNFIKQTLLDLKPGVDPNIIILNDCYKTEHLFMIKALNKPVIEEMHLNIIKAIHGKPVVNIILSGKKTAIISSKVRNEPRVSSLSTLI